MNCILPLFLLIVAPEPCAVYEHLQAQVVKVEHSRAVERFYRGLPNDPKTLEETVGLGRLLKVIEEQEPFPCGGGYLCAGNFSNFLGVMTLRYVGSLEESRGVVFHELGHMLYRWNSLAESAAVGHGGPDDPHFIFAKQWLDWHYPVEGHPYNPTLLPSLWVELDSGLVYGGLVCRVLAMGVQ
jgi:hypothetical protein